MSEITTEMVIEIINKYMQEFVGDTPVPYQIGMAIDNKANVDEQHALLEEVRALRAEVQRLTELVGDTPVVEQISMAFNG